jgi:hypothetical protein
MVALAVKVEQGASHSSHRGATQKKNLSKQNTAIHFGILLCAIVSGCCVLQ